MPHYLALTYYPSRLLLAVTCLVWIARTRNRLMPWHLAWFSLLTCLVAVYDLIPPAVASPTYWRVTSAPYAVVSFLVSMLTSISLFKFLHGRVTRSERRFLALFTTAIATALVLIAWEWHPQNTFQAVQIGRQYALFVLAGAVTLAWVSVRHIEPVHIRAETHAFTPCWLTWLWASFVMSTTTTGGLLWLKIPRKNKDWLWYSVCLTGTLVQTIVMLRLHWRMNSVTTRDSVWEVYTQTT